MKVLLGIFVCLCALGMIESEKKRIANTFVRCAGQELIKGFKDGVTNARDKRKK